jgi:hypothetical protein
MSKTLTVINERVDDILLLLAFLKQMEVQSLLDQDLPTDGYDRKQKMWFAEAEQLHRES